VATSKPALSVFPAAQFGVFLLVAACGCSKSGVTFAPVEGTVTCNGRPVPYAQVIFVVDTDNQGPRAVGVTDEAGHFRLATDDGKDGAPVGRHRVCVIDASTMAAKVGKMVKHAPEVPGKGAPLKKATSKPAIPPEYGRPAGTPLRAEVRPGAQTIDFQLP
jgi:hypothetical protein